MIADIKGEIRNIKVQQFGMTPEEVDKKGRNPKLVDLPMSNRTDDSARKRAKFA